MITCHPATQPGLKTSDPSESLALNHYATLDSSPALWLQAGLSTLYAQYTPHFYAFEPLFKMDLCLECPQCSYLQILSELSQKCVYRECFKNPSSTIVHFIKFPMYIYPILTHEFTYSFNKHFLSTYFEPAPYQIFSIKMDQSQFPALKGSYSSPEVHPSIHSVNTG